MEQHTQAEKTEHQEELEALRLTSDALHDMKAYIREGDKAAEKDMEYRARMHTFQEKKYNKALSEYRVAVDDFNDGSDKIEGDQWDFKLTQKALKLFDTQYKYNTIDEYFEQKFVKTKADGAQFIDPLTMNGPTLLDLSNVKKMTTQEKAGAALINAEIDNWHQRLNPEGEPMYTVLYNANIIKKKGFNAEAQASSLHWETPHLPHMTDLSFYREVLSGTPKEIQNIVDHEVLHRLWELLGEDETKQTKLFSATEKLGTMGLFVKIKTNG